jgi:polysaccharide biosynthesis protein PslH
MSKTQSPDTDVLVTPFTPTMDRGRAMRTYGVVAALARHRPVEILFKRFCAAQPSEEYRRLARVRLRDVSSAKGPELALLYARKRLAGVPPAIARGLSPELGRAASATAAATPNARLIADGPAAAALLLGGSIAFVYLSHNLESAFRPALPQFRRSYGSIRALRGFERRLLLTATECWMASRRDIELALELAPEANLRYVPNVVDVASIPVPAAPVSAPRALLVGDFSYPPNQRALRFMVDEVMPRVWTTLPEAELLLVGHHLTLDRVDRRVKALGFVPRISDAYAEAACAVVPLLEGGGSPLKFIEALAHGVPVVATERAAAGLDVVDGVHYHRAEGTPAFADALTRVLRDGAAEMARRARRLAEREYSIEALEAILAPNSAGDES